MIDDLLFPQLKIPPGLAADIRRLNPWWEGKPLPILPPTRPMEKRRIASVLASNKELGF